MGSRPRDPRPFGHLLRMGAGGTRRGTTVVSHRRRTNLGAPTASSSDLALGFRSPLEDRQNGLGRYEILVSPPKASPNFGGEWCTRTRPLRVRARHQSFTVRPVGERGKTAIKSIVVEGWIAFTVAGASRLRASTPGSRSTASGSSAEPGLHQRARARRRTLLQPDTLAGDSSPHTPPAASPNPN